MIKLGTVQQIARYPVKSMAGVSVESAELGLRGLIGDRRLAIRRIEVAGTDTASALVRKVQLGMNDVSMASLARYYASRLLQRLRP